MKKIGRAGAMEQEKRSRFVLRRACWFGEVSIRDVVEAFDVSRQTASLDLDHAVGSWTRYDGQGCVQPILKQERKKVSPGVLPSFYPEKASARTMMRLLANASLAGATLFQETGLRDTEVNRVFPVPGCRQVDDTVISDLLSAAIKGHTATIRYVGLKRGDLYRDRLIAPVALEFDGATVRVHAHDLDAEGWPIKTFVLSRISELIKSERSVPKKIARAPDVDRYKKRRFKVTLDPRLTDDQRDALSRELRITPAGIIDVDEIHAHAFKRLYTNGVPHESNRDIVWPPIIFTEDLG